MYYALWQGEAVTAQAIVEKSIRQGLRLEQLTFFCPDCQQPVRLVRSQKKRPYFTHLTQPKVSENESRWHRENKSALAQLLKRSGYQVEVEAVQANRERRADLLVTGAGLARAIAVELQSSRLSAQAVSQRMTDYAQCDCEVLWLLNPNQDYYHCAVSHLTTLAPFMVNIAHFGLTIPYWLAEERVGLVVLDGFGRPTCQLHLSIADYLLLRQGRAEDHYTLTLPSILLPPNTLQRKWTRVLRQPTHVEKSLLISLYQQQRALADIPEALAGVEASCLFVEEKMWQVLSWVWLMMTTETIQANEVIQRVRPHLHVRPFTCAYQCAYQHWLLGAVRAVAQVMATDQD